MPICRPVTRKAITMSSQDSRIQVPATAGENSQYTVAGWCDSELTAVTPGLRKS